MDWATSTQRLDMKIQFEKKVCCSTEPNFQTEGIEVLFWLMNWKCYFYVCNQSIIDVEECKEPVGYGKCEFPIGGGRVNRFMRQFL